MTTMIQHVPLPGRERSRLPVSGLADHLDLAGSVSALTEDFHFERAFTLAEVAKKIGISLRQVQAHVDDGNLVAVNVGRGGERRDLRVLDEDLEGFMRRRKTGVVTEAPPQTVRRRKEPAATPAGSFLERRAARLREGNV